MLINNIFVTDFSMTNPTGKIVSFFLFMMKKCNAHNQLLNVLNLRREKWCCPSVLQLSSSQCCLVFILFCGRKLNFDTVCFNRIMQCHTFPYKHIMWKILIWWNCMPNHEWVPFLQLVLFFVNSNVWNATHIKLCACLDISESMA